MKLHSQQVRAPAPESDPLKIGMGWAVDDLSKPQIIVESTFGDSHPGSAHLDQFVRQAVQAVNEHGGKAARYFATDLCDGIAQGHDGINYSLAHREAIVDLVEAQANASGFDGGIFIASCDKAVPAMLMSIGQLKEMSAIVVTGGVIVPTTLAMETIMPKWMTLTPSACATGQSTGTSRTAVAMPSRKVPKTSRMSATTRQYIVAERFMPTTKSTSFWEMPA